MDVFSTDYLDWIEYSTSKSGTIRDDGEDEHAPFIKDLYFKIHDFFIENYVFKIDHESNIFPFTYNDKSYIIGELFDEDDNKNLYTLSLVHTMGNNEFYVDINDIVNNKVPYGQEELRNRMNMIKSCVDDLYNMGVPLSKIYFQTYRYVLNLNKKNNN